jgi:hypothetical protein
MADTITYAERVLAGGTVFLRRESLCHRWEISIFSRFSHFQPIGITGIRWDETLREHPVLHRTFATLEEAAEAVQQALGA